MNQEQRPDGRPRVASFLIDDILAPQAVSTVALCPNQSSQAVEAVLRYPTTGAVMDSSFSCNPAFASACLHCYGSRRHVSRHPCYWNTPYTCYTAAATHGYGYHSNSSFLTTPDSFTDYGNSHPSTSSETFTQPIHGQTRPRRPRRPWTRAVFSNLQRKGLEKRFQVQKYLTKADRHQLAAMLGLSDNQVKVWFQNRRMKWRQEARESVTSTITEAEDEESWQRLTAGHFLLRVSDTSISINL